MARDNEDIYLRNTLTGFCAKLNAGLICDDVVHEVKRVSLIRDVNKYIEEGSVEVCEQTELIVPPSIICQEPGEIDPEYPFVVSDPIAEENILYGWYDLNPDTQPNPVTPNAADVAVDIVTNPDNYTSDSWIPTGLPANIVNSQIAYHVVRLPISIPSIKIVDEAGVTVTSAWNVLTDGVYNYYVLMTPVAINANVTYTLKE